MITPEVVIVVRKPSGFLTTCTANCGFSRSKGPLGIESPDYVAPPLQQQCRLYRVPDEPLESPMMFSSKRTVPIHEMVATMNPWNELSDQYAGINEQRIRIVFHYLLERLAADTPHVLLDYGTGDGKFPELCSKLPIDHMWAYDPAPKMAQLTRARCSNLANLRVVTETQAIEPGSVDIVTLNAVWMCLSTEQACVTVLRDIFQLLKPHGLLIASVTHPCFRNLVFSTYSTDFKQRDYLQAGTSFQVNLFDEYTKMVIKDTHWSIAAMSHQLMEADFLIEEIVETPDEPTVSGPCEGSPWMVIFARKNHRNTPDTR